MDNEALILQLLTEMKQDMSGLQQHMTTFEGHMASVDNRITSIEDRMESFEDRMESFEGRMESFEGRLTSVEDRLEEQTVSINLNIENNIGKRLDALFEGYMLNSEKYGLLDHRVDTVEKRVDKLEIAAG